jgi:two-component system sensor histidine kinase RegB
MRLRWIALSGQAFCIVPGLAFGFLEVRFLPSFIGTIATMAILNTITWKALQQDSPFSTGRYVLLIQLVFDIGGLSALLALTGGARNPLTPLLFVHAGIGALLLGRKQSSVLFALIISCLVVLQFFSQVPPALQEMKIPLTMLFPAQVLVAVVFWILTIWLSSTLDSLREASLRAREQSTRIDRLRAVGALAAGLSHEFATPLNTAQIRLSRLGRKEQLQSNSDLAAAVDSLERCDDILRRMAGAPLRPEKLDLQAFDVRKFVERVCLSFSAAHPEMSIQVHDKGDGPHRALLPQVAFSQALIYLIDNAVESAGAEEPVDVVVESTREHVDVSVLDRGEGWPEIVRTHIGQPFLTTKPDGVGLGLYFVHTLIEALGGSFHMEDRSERGAIARISLLSADTE